MSACCGAASALVLHVLEERRADLLDLLHDEGRALRLVLEVLAAGVRDHAVEFQTEVVEVAASGAQSLDGGLDADFALQGLDGRLVEIVRRGVHERALSAAREQLRIASGRVRNQTDKSHVMQYGDISWTALPIGDFIGNKGKFAKGRVSRVAAAV